MMTLWCFLQGIINICCLKITKCHGMVLFDKDGGGGSIPAGLGWYEFAFRMDEGPESYVNRMSERGVDKSGGEGGRVYISFRKENLCGAINPSET